METVMRIDELVKTQKSQLQCDVLGSNTFSVATNRRASDFEQHKHIAIFVNNSVLLDCKDIRN